MRVDYRTGPQVKDLLRVWEFVQDLPKKGHISYVAFPCNPNDLDYEDLLTIEKTSFKSDSGEVLYKLTTTSKAYRAVEPYLHYSHVMEYAEYLNQKWREYTQLWLRASKCQTHPEWPQVALTRRHSQWQLPPHTGMTKEVKAALEEAYFDYDSANLGIAVGDVSSRLVEKLSNEGIPDQLCEVLKLVIMGEAANIPF